MSKKKKNQCFDLILKLKKVVLAMATMQTLARDGGFVQTQVLVTSCILNFGSTPRQGKLLEL